VADRTLLMLGEGEYVCGAAGEALTEERMRRLYGVDLRRVDFEFQSETLTTLVPVYAGLRRKRESKDV
jgi:ABC-type cobalamin transport system ATPase subunit